MKFLLVTALDKKFVKLWACQETSHIGSMLPPSDLCSIASNIRSNGHDAAILDLRLFADPVGTYVRKLKEYGPDAVILNISTTTANDDFRIVSLTPDPVKKIAFGTHAIAEPGDCFQHGVDFILAGDPEKCIMELADHGLAPDKTRGVISKDTVIEGFKPLYEEDLDHFPLPALDLVDLDRYHTLFVKNRRFSVILGSRGCHFECNFCLMPCLFGAKIRQRSAKNIIDEMKRDFEMFKVRDFVFLDATFNSSESRVFDICEEIDRNKMNFVRWSCNMRVSPVSGALLKAMKRSGCQRIFYGVEDAGLLNEINKNITFEQIKKAFYLTRKHRIEAGAFLMLFPNGAVSEADYTAKIVRLIKEIKADMFQCNVAIPFPGTAMYKKMKNDLSGNWSLYDPNGTCLPYSSPVDLVSVKNSVYLKIALSSPRIVLRTLLTANREDLIYVIKKFIAMIRKGKKGRWKK